MKPALAALLAAIVFSAAAHAADRPAMVIQVSDADPGKWSLALANARNLQTEFGQDGVALEIVVYGPGVRMLTADSEFAGRVADTVAAGIPVVACENTLRALKLEHADMHAGIGYVPVGAGEILRLQQKGWAYLKP